MGTIFVFGGAVGIRFYGSLLDIKALKQLLSRAENRVGELERQALTSGGASARFRQERAFNELSSLFGYHLEKMEYHLTIYSLADTTDGRGESVSNIDFKANLRSLGSWQRAVRCKSAIPPGATKWSINAPYTLGHKIVPTNDPNQVVERFIFDPTIADDKVVAMRLEETLPPKSFLTKATGSQTEDDVTFLVGVPIRCLKLLLEFDGFSPNQQDIRADACIGRAKEIFYREALDVSESLKIGNNGAKRTATFQIDYPIVGVTYRLIWKCN